MMILDWPGAENYCMGQQSAVEAMSAKDILIFRVEGESRLNIVRRSVDSFERS
jgi:hypothetical protein